MSVNTDFSSLNFLRPSDASFGEVVHISLYVAEGGGLTFIGDSKRKSVHVPPSSNAYWNFVGLRSALVQYFTREGVQRPLRTWMTAELRNIVEAVHKRELEATYSRFDYVSVQYYDVVLYPTDYWLLTAGKTVGEDSMLKGHDLMLAAAYASRDYREGSVEPGSQLIVDGLYGIVELS